MGQILINISLTIGSVLSVSVGVFLIYRLYKFLPFTCAASFMLGPYLVYGFSKHTSSCLSVLYMCICLTVLALPIGHVFASRSRRHQKSSLELLLVSLGLVIFAQNAIGILMGHQPIPLSLNIRASAIAISVGHIGIARLLMCICGCSSLIAAGIVQGGTRKGLALHAIMDNCNLARISGVDTQFILVITFAICSVLWGVAGVLHAIDYAMTPHMGVQPFMIGVVVAMVGGRRLTGVLAASALVSVVQNVSGLLLGNEWEGVLVFGILLIVLFMQPQGILSRTW